MSLTDYDRGMIAGFLTGLAGFALGLILGWYL